MSSSIIQRFYLRVIGVVTVLGLQLFFISSASFASPIPNRDESAASGKSLVYTMTNPNGDNAIVAFERNTQTGELTFFGTYPTGGRGTGSILDSQSPLIVDPSGAFLIAINPASNDISVMAIQPDGSLSLVGQPVPSRGIAPGSLAINRDRLYVANKGDATTPPNYAGFRLNVDGSLTNVKRPFELAIGDNPTQILFNPAGNMLIGLRLGGRGVDCFRVKPTGRLRLLRQLNEQTGPFAGVFNPANDSQLIVGDARLPGAVSYTVSTGGDIRRISAISNAPERAACWIVANNTGTFYWISNTGSGTLSLFSLAANGELNLLSSHNTLAFGRLPFEIALDKDNRFLYELNVGNGGTIHALRLTASTANAGLEDIGAVAVNGGTPAGLVIVE
ncbi:MAG: beta-propeller fold lactonase family protein [Acidobacteriota bacterium]